MHHGQLHRSHRGARNSAQPLGRHGQRRQHLGGLAHTVRSGQGLDDGVTRELAMAFPLQAIALYVQTQKIAFQALRGQRGLAR